MHGDGMLAHQRPCIAGDSFVYESRPVVTTLGMTNWVSYRAALDVSLLPLHLFRGDRSTAAVPSINGP